MYPPVAKALADLEKAVVDLQGALSAHAFYRGTYDSVLTEVQNGLIPKPGGGTFKHLDSLTQGRQSAINATDKVRAALKQLRALDFKSANALEDALRPLVGPAGQAGRTAAGIVGLADRKIDLAGRTLELVRELEMLHPERLTGVPLAAKGRTEKALTTSQLDKLRVQPISPGVVDHPQWKALLADIAAEPLDAAKLGDEVAAANRAVGVALRNKLALGPTAPVRQFAFSLAARFDGAGRLATAAGRPNAPTGPATLKQRAAATKADSQLDEAAQAVEKLLAKQVPGSAAEAAARGRLVKAFGRRVVKIAESRVARRLLSVAPVVGWGFSAADAWAGGKDVIRGNVGRGLSGIGLAVADVASDFLHLGDLVSGVGGTALSLAAQGGTIAGQVAVEMDRVKENMAKVMAEVDRTGQLPADARLKNEFEMDDDTIAELKQAMAA